MPHCRRCRVIFSARDRYCGYCGRVLVWAARGVAGGAGAAAAGAPEDGAAAVVLLTRVKRRPGATLPGSGAATTTASKPLRVWWPVITFDGPVGHNVYRGLDDGPEQTGVFIATAAPVEVGERISVALRPPGLSCAERVTGRVTWVREDTPRNDGLAPGMGVSFDDATPALRRALERLTRSREPVFYDDSYDSSRL